MKTLVIYIVCILSAYSTFAEDGGKGKIKPAEGGVKVKLHGLTSAHLLKDSVLFIFDRYNRSGAGILHKVFYADSNYNILISGVPVGKYYLTIQCRGLHHGHWEKVITIRSCKYVSIKIRPDKYEEYSKEQVVIPAYCPDLTNLSILNMRTSGGSRQRKSFPIF